MSRIVNEIKEGLREIKVYSSVTITPNIATELLKLNTANRPMKDKFVKEYARRMRNNEWVFNGENIVISKTGKLQNGQKRCMAIIESGCPQVYNIQTGIDDRAFDTMDDGQIRSASDALSVLNYNNAAALSVMLRAIITYEKQGAQYVRAFNRGSFGIDRISNTEMVKYMQTADKDYIIGCLNEAKSILKQNRLLQPPITGALIYMFAKPTKIDYYKALEFFQKLASGADISLDHYSSVYLLREKLIQWKSASFDIAPDIKYAHIIKAWNYFKENRKIKRLSWSNLEDFPEIK